MTSSPFFNAHHSPIGAFASFSFGCKGPKGGLGLELSGPANENLFIGCEDSVCRGRFRAFPFYEFAGDREADFHGHISSDGDEQFESFPDSEIERVLRPCVDSWRAGDLTFRVISPVEAVPDPAGGGESELKDVLCPAVLVELTLDNTAGTFPRTVFFGYEGSDRSSGMRVLDHPQLIGVGQGLRTAVVTLDPMVAGLGWSPSDLLDLKHLYNAYFMLGPMGLLTGVVAAGETRSFKIAVCFHRAGIATAGLPTRYLYNRWFEGVDDVAKHALSRFDGLVRRAEAVDRELLEGLEPNRALSLSHAVRSYYGSTQLLEREDGRPVWVVNEGEYRMMNTSDLMADQALFELRMNPWTVRNELDLYSERYSYRDTVRYPGSLIEYPGGVAFAHDVGVTNVFSRPGCSAYEKAGLTGCFSFMTCEELTNWVICACLYVLGTGDSAWTERNLPLLEECLESLCHRDDPDPARRNGVMGLDSSKCEGGSEITTYDSLDSSLGRARGNLYLVVKWWAAFVMMERVFRQNGKDRAADEAGLQAQKSADSVVASRSADGSLPALLDDSVPARIIPAIEGLVFPLQAGMHDVLRPNGRYGSLLRTLGEHIAAVLKPGVCKFDDGAWKLSSTSDNSWLSKIYLCQYVAGELFGIRDPAADKAHWGWLMDEANVYYAWSDQMVRSKAVGSRYYPRGVTSILWTRYRQANLQGSEPTVPAAMN
ncbi:MAG TPA: glycoside hydrolase family 52 protein [Fimbriimonas sp.]|nr:glycoside hydrolase family 52 protein [Fimbriimonas sp.]